MIPLPIPFEEREGKVVLTGPVLLSCGCGSINARWASLSPMMEDKIPQAKPKSSPIVKKWIEQEKLDWPELKNHTYGLVVGETEKGFEYVDILARSTMNTLDAVKKLIKESKEYAEHRNQATGEGTPE